MFLITLMICSAFCILSLSVCRTGDPGRVWGWYLILDDISLDQIRESDNFDFKYLYEMSEGNIEDDSPFNNKMTKCNYYDADHFNKMASEYNNPTSYFHLNCRSLSSNWLSFKELLCQLHRNTFAFDFIGISEVFILIVIVTYD